MREPQVVWPNFRGRTVPIGPPVIDAIVYVIGRRGDDVINTCALKSVADQSGQTAALVAAGSVLTDAALRAAASLRITLVEIYVRPDQCHVTRSRDNRCALQFTHVNTTSSNNFDFSLVTFCLFSFCVFTRATLC